MSIRKELEGREYILVTKNISPSPSCGNSGSVQFVLDYRNAFDLIDHSLLMAKLLQYDINP